MNFIQFESEQKLRGGFYTAPLSRRSWSSGLK